MVPVGYDLGIRLYRIIDSSSIGQRFFSYLAGTLAFESPLWIEVDIVVVGFVYGFDKFLFGSYVRVEDTKDLLELSLILFAGAVVDAPRDSGH